MTQDVQQFLWLVKYSNADIYCIFEKKKKNYSEKKNFVIIFEEY